MATNNQNAALNVEETSTSSSNSKIYCVTTHCRTSPKIKKFNYTWSISKFVQTLAFAKYLQSGYEEKQPLQIEMENDTRKLSFFARNYNENIVQTNCFVYVHTTKGRKKYNSSIKNVPNGCAEFILDVDAIMFCKEPTKYLPNNTLTISFEFHIFDIFINSIVSKDTIASYEPLSENRPFDVDSTQVTFIVKEERLYANKELLCKNPVFAAMFDHDLQENVTNEIKIVDINYFSLQQLLSFIQFGFVPNVQNLEGALELFIAADKYNEQDLKLICEHHLMNEMTVEDIVTFVDVAIKYNGTNLLNYIKHFSKLYLPDIINTESFTELMQKHFDLVREIICTEEPETQEAKYTY